MRHLAVVLVVAASSAGSPQPGHACRLVALASVDCADGAIVRLEGLAPEPFAAGAARLIAQAGRRVVVTGAADRTGAAAAALFDDVGRLLQVRLVEAGLARAWPSADRALHQQLLELEDAAAAAGRGGWGEGGRFRHLAAVPPPSAEGFAVVRGLVRSSGTTRRHAYLNFGESYRSDFTVRLRRGDARGWDWWDDLERFVGRRIEVRGFVFSDGGPMIELDAPTQLRVLD